MCADWHQLANLEQPSLGKLRILWLGLGQLGRALAGRLGAIEAEVEGVDPGAPAGLPFHVYERLHDAVGQYPVMVACLPTVKDLLESVEYACALPEDLRPSVFINVSTIGPRAAVEAAGMTQSVTGISYIEAPVSGGVLRARQGNIAIFWGSDSAAEHVGLAQMVLELLANTVVKVGSVAAASGVKLVNNFLAIANTFALIEGLRLALALDLPPEMTRELLENGTADSYVLRSTVKRPMVSGDMTTGFVTRLALKDMLLLREAIGSTRSETLDSLVAELTDAVNRGYAEKVFPAAPLARHLGVGRDADQASPGEKD